MNSEVIDLTIDSDCESEISTVRLSEISMDDESQWDSDRTDDESQWDSDDESLEDSKVYHVRTLVEVIDSTTEDDDGGMDQAIDSKNTEVANLASSSGSGDGEVMEVVDLTSDSGDDDVSNLSSNSEGDATLHGPTGSSRKSRYRRPTPYPRFR